MDADIFEKAYDSRPPWDIEGPQPEIVRLAEAGAIDGTVLDVGCGTGENALYLAGQGLDVWGIDFIPKAIEQARDKALKRGLQVHFQVGDALKLEVLGRTFDTVIDSGLFHTFSDEEQSVFVRGLARVVRPGGAGFILCFSDEEPPGQGPRRVSRDEIRSAFREWWEVESIEQTRFRAIDDPQAPRFSPGGPKAYLITIRRTAAPAPSIS
jgi:ubiquinone/menaquinone biosynthesis C-methylase UbiE